MEPSDTFLPTMSSVSNVEENPVAVQCFRERFCERFDLTEAEYERECVARCSYRGTGLIRAVVSLFFPDLCEDDFNLARHVGDAKSWDEVTTAVRFHRRTTLAKGLFRDRLRVRISTEDLLKLGRELFGDDTGAAA